MQFFKETVDEQINKSQVIIAGPVLFNQGANAVGCPAPTADCFALPKLETKWRAKEGGLPARTYR